MEQETTTEEKKTNKNIRFLGICILLSSIILGGVIMFRTLTVDRYYFSDDGHTYICSDKLTAKTYIHSGGRATILNYKTGDIHPIK